ILSKIEYAYTTGDVLGTALKTVTYNYGDANWKDKFTSITVRIGEGNPQIYDITYDAIGNPLTYNGYTYTWEMGRQLAGISGNGINASFKYNAEGIRTQKTVGTVTTKYHLVGDKVTLESNGCDTIDYSYDSSDNLISMKLNGVEYYYIRNAQGDILGLLDGTGTQVASYTYDSWGKLISIKDQNGNDVTNTTWHIGYKNPYRYKGYRYDNETGMYYLQSRYYSPEWGRFINADALVGETGQLLSHNMFAYCLNNPVNMEDSDGDVPKWAKHTWDRFVKWNKNSYKNMKWAIAATFMVTYMFYKPYIDHIILRKVSNIKFPKIGTSKSSFGKKSVGAAQYQPTSIKMVKDNYLKKNGIDAHKLKAEVVGKNNVSKYDIYVDKDTGQLWVYRKKGIGEGIRTGEYIK
ncbi:RHS repeat-associated core domain-containing protein, partial [Fervidicella metallireducens]|uniref:RHS repeat-associated core domain-containing protein n=1 Tax=Fervidicella metallireducens TaxID=655338 RepID=UPI000686046F